MKRNSRTDPAYEAVVETLADLIIEATSDEGKLSALAAKLTGRDMKKRGIRTDTRAKRAPRPPISRSNAEVALALTTISATRKNGKCAAFFVWKNESRPKNMSFPRRSGGR